MEPPVVPVPLSVMPRLPGLDVLRAVAISWVMLYHASLFGLDSPDAWIVRFGWMGVDLFFALSGFLIAGQLLRPFARGQRPNYPRFFARRWLRTVPAYLAVVALYFLVPAVRERPDLQPLWQFLTFSENLFIAPPLPKAFSQVWSLCVEEQFYVVFPALVALLAIRPSAAKTIGAFVAVLLFGMALRGFLWLHDVARTPFGIASAPQPAAYMRLIYWPRPGPVSTGCWPASRRRRCRPSAPDCGRGSPRVRSPDYSSNSTFTGAWSEGRAQSRASRSTCIEVAASASAGLTQTWSSRRPLSAFDQSGER
jgi:peptidoglycan/LPS O-acetylase OafA/YrhL